MLSDVSFLIISFCSASIFRCCNIGGGKGNGELDSVSGNAECDIDFAGDELGKLKGWINVAGCFGLSEVLERLSEDSRCCDSCVGTIVLICDGRNGGGDDGIVITSP